MNVHALTILFLFLSCLVNGCGGNENSETGNFDAGSSGALARSSACDLLGLRSTALRVLNGQRCEPLKGSPVVRVAARLTSGKSELILPICTGTLISSHDVLTAAHCVNLASLDDQPVTSYAIVLGEGGSSGTFNVKKIAFAPGLLIAEGRLINDVAILTLEQPSGAGVVPILTSSPVITGERGFVYGFGRTSSESNLARPKFSTLEAGIMEIEDVSEDHIRTEYDGENANVCNGDSGGPLLVVREGIGALVGVVSQGSVDDCGVGDVTTFANLTNQDLLGWILSIVPDAATM